MLPFTSTYLLDLACRKYHHQNIPAKKAELILGSVIPDLATHLGREQFQAIAHNLGFFTSLIHRGFLKWGAIFHILCDNYSTPGRIILKKNYHYRNTIL
ncbi:MAG: hypothetical protein ACFFDN_35075 [Candidatus Hodarchaeota archaeon]